MACGQRPQSVTYDIGNQLEVNPFTPSTIPSIYYIRLSFLRTWSVKYYHHEALTYIVSLWQLLHNQGRSFSNCFCVFVNNLTSPSPSRAFLFVTRYEQCRYVVRSIGIVTNTHFIRWRKRSTQIKPHLITKDKFD